MDSLGNSIVRKELTIKNRNMSNLRERPIVHLKARSSGI